MVAKIIKVTEVSKNGYTVVMQIQDDKGSVLLDETVVLPDISDGTVLAVLTKFSDQYKIDTVVAVDTIPNINDVVVPTIEVEF